MYMHMIHGYGLGQGSVGGWGYGSSCLAGCSTTGSCCTAFEGLKMSYVLLSGLLCAGGHVAKPLGLQVQQPLMACSQCWRCAACMLRCRLLASCTVDARLRPCLRLRCSISSASCIYCVLLLFLARVFHRCSCCEAAGLVTGWNVQVWPRICRSHPNRFPFCSPVATGRLLRISWASLSAGCLLVWV